MSNTPERKDGPQNPLREIAAGFVDEQKGRELTPHDFYLLTLKLEECCRERPAKGQPDGQ